MITDRKILDYENLKETIDNERKNGKKIVFMSGCFDIMHVAHAWVLDFAKSKGDVLIVGIGSDETIRKLKGDNRPFFNEEVRSKMIAAIETVDYVLINKEELVDKKIDFKKAVSIIKPEIFVCPFDDGVIDKKRKLAEEFGGKLVEYTGNVDGKYAYISTTKIIEKIRKDEKFESD